MKYLWVLYCILFIFSSCSEDEVAIDEINCPKPIFDIYSGFVTAWNTSYDDGPVGHLVCDDGTHDYINFDEKDGCFCPLPITNCYPTVLIIGKKNIAEYLNFKDAVASDNISNYFSDPDWDSSFFGSTYLNDLRTGNVKFVGLNWENQQEIGDCWIAIPDNLVDSFSYADVEFVFPVIEE